MRGSRSRRRPSSKARCCAAAGHCARPARARCSAGTARRGSRATVASRCSSPGSRAERADDADHLCSDARVHFRYEYGATARRRRLQGQNLRTVQRALQAWRKDAETERNLGHARHGQGGSLNTRGAQRGRPLLDARIARPVAVAQGCLAARRLERRRTFPPARLSPVRRRPSLLPGTAPAASSGAACVRDLPA